MFHTADRSPTPNANDLDLSGQMCSTGLHYIAHVAAWELYNLRAVTVYRLPIRLPAKSALTLPVV